MTRIYPTASCESSITIIDGEKVSCSIGVSDRSDGRQATFSKPLTCCSTGNCRPNAERRISTTGSPPYNGARMDHGFSRLVERDLPIRMSRIVCERCALSAFHIAYDSTIFSLEAAHGRIVPPDRQNADPPGDAYKYSLGQPFIYPKKTTSIFVRISCVCAMRAVRDYKIARFLPAARPYLHSPCRS